MKEIKIEKNIPFPKRRLEQKRKGDWINLLNMMDIGDSIVLPEKDAKNFRSAIYRHSKIFKFKSFRLEDNKLRLWKIKALKEEKN